MPILYARLALYTPLLKLELEVEDMGVVISLVGDMGLSLKPGFPNGSEGEVVLESAVRVLGEYPLSVLGGEGCEDGK